MFVGPARAPNYAINWLTIGGGGAGTGGVTNLSSWTPPLTNSASPFDFTDSEAAGSGRRFYRSRGL